MQHLAQRRNHLVCVAHQLVTKRVAELIKERAELEEEVRQLRAAVQIWTSVAQQTSRADKSTTQAIGGE
jgi:hypothetical protein